MDAGNSRKTFCLSGMNAWLFQMQPVSELGRVCRAYPGARHLGVLYPNTNGALKATPVVSARDAGWTLGSRCPGAGRLGRVFHGHRTGQRHPLLYQSGRNETFARSTHYQTHFYPAIFNNFAARMDWAKDGKGNRNPIVIVNDSTGMDIISLNPQPGTSVTLDASKSHDPDGDKLTFSWWVLPDAGCTQRDHSLR